MRDTERIIGNSVTLTQALEQVSRLAPIQRPVLVIGERGTGKELAAERLHYLSPRWDGPFLKVNCAAIAEQLLESELFGHEPGAFTGATRTHRGRFERADGGTLFLDELGTMSTGLQEKLLRAIEYGEFERLGGQTTIAVDVRVIAATNANLRQLAAEGKFREDLLDRLSFDVVHLPPLRHRLSDVPELAHHFAVQMCSELGWELFQGFSEKAARQLLEYPWPGNVRELKNVVERSVSRWGNPDAPVGDVVIDPFDSPYEDWGTPNQSAPPAGAGASAPSPATAPPRPNQPAVPSPPVRFSRAVADFEKRLLREALDANDYHQANTARDLGLSYDQLRGLLKKYRLGKRKRRAAAA
ncbi:MAG: phage shock protein operon transcriptional activator [Halieaceae bacterium]|jgi:psp operon transcriptional activator|nr:phage shock protein operon transcriptional activator [Halieaceae bacterium]